MKKLLLIFIIVVLAGVGILTLLNYQKSQKPAESISVSGLNEEENNMKISSPEFSSYQFIPSKYTCDGGDVNPPLAISGVPKDSKSLVLIMDDPDAPAGTWTHWTVWNINPSVAGIAENSVPAGSIQGVTSFGKPGYGGPCPPDGQHRYFFKLYALDILLDLSSAADASEIVKAMEGHINATTELVGFYAKK